MTTQKNDIDAIEQSGLFDKNWYLSEYSDVASLGLHPVEHYLQLGARLLRNPSQKFDTRYYLESNPDVAAAKVNPLMHYVMYGAKEGRAPLPSPIHEDPSLASRALQQTANGQALPKPVAQGKSSCRGFLDRFDETSIVGWAIDESKPGAPVALTIYLNGILLMEVKTAQPRGDLAKNGWNGDTAGFSLTFPAGLLPPESVIDVRFSKTGGSLSKSPRKLESATRPPLRHCSTYIDAYRAGMILPTTVVVPIFNAYDAVSECLHSLATHFPERTEVLLVNDCSTDPRIPELLQSYATRPHWKVHHNPENIGYTRSVNRGISLCPEHDVVLLNSDTVVTERWLENLRYCAYAHANVATVTALSNNAGAFCSPEIGVYNPVPPHMTNEQFARTIVYAGEGRLLEVPTGNGFCMFIRRAAVASIGLFDEQKYPRGYGEENDLCMRATRKGWLNLVCDKTYVFHKRSQSFQDEKKALMEAGSQQVNADYPEYRLLTQRFRDIEFSYVRHLARMAVKQAQPNKALRRVLYVISTKTGGMPQTNLDLMRALREQYHCFLLRCDASTITLSELIDGELQPIETHTLSRTIDPVSHRSDEYDRLVLDILYRYSISLLHIRHIAWHSLGLSQVAHSIGIPVVYSVHDFYTLCPTVNLVDGDRRYCGGRCGEGGSECRIGLWPRWSFPALKGRFIHRWHDMFNAFLQHCDRLITTSPSTVNIFGGVYPEAAQRMSIIPHGRDLMKCTPSQYKYVPGSKIRVLVPGNIGVNKGALLIKEMVELDKESRFEFHILGAADPSIRNIGVHHGEYERSTFAEKVNAIAPHFGVVLSICPETYCHTLTEMWSCGIPVFGMDLGAVGDRIRATEAGWLISPEDSAGEILKKMAQAVANPKDLDKKTTAISKWQATEGIWNDTGTMATEYRRIYQTLLQRGKASAQKRIGLLIKGENEHPSTTHIRILKPLKTAVVADGFDARPVTVPWLLAGGMDHLDGLLVQNDAVPAEQVDALLHGLQAHGLPLLYEIDDLLWKLPAHHPGYTITDADKAAMRKLAASARTVTTSTPRLAEQLASIAPRVVVIPNALDEALWLKPLSQEFIEEVGRQLGLTAGKRRLLYMGSASHASDLNMIAPAIKTVIAKMPEVQILQIGGGHLLPHAQEITMPQEANEYPAFVTWFRAVCTYATVAIAPLRNDPFNAVKSDIKALDYALARVPAIYSNVAPYTETVNHQQTGLLCPNKSTSWSDAILALLEDEGLREKIRDAAFAHAQARGLTTIAPQWREVMTHTFDAGGR